MIVRYLARRFIGLILTRVRAGDTGSHQGGPSASDPTHSPHRPNSEAGKRKGDTMTNHTADEFRTAWENAEQADECRKGDVLIAISRSDEGFNVYKAVIDDDLTPEKTRILSRTPREPWQDLADALQAEGIFLDDEDLEKYSQRLHERGVRMTGGDEK